MRQFDVHQNPSERSRPIAPFVVVLQSHHLSAAPVVVVAPLLKNDGLSAYTGTGVIITFHGAEYIASVGELVAIDARGIRRAVGDLREYEDDFRRALDRLFTGF